MSITVKTDPRGHVELVHAPEIEPGPIPAEGWLDGAQVKVLSRDAVTGAFSGVLRLPKGYSRPDGTSPRTRSSWS